MAEQPTLELQQQQVDKLTAIVQQLQISNSAEGSTKDQFMKANEDILNALLVSNVLAEEAEDNAQAEEKTSQSVWNKMLNIFGWMKKDALRTGKLDKLKKSQAVKFGKTKLAKVEAFAGNMLDLLLKGLGLAALWGLFKFLEGKDWDKIVEKVKSWVEMIGLDWDATVTTLEGIWTLLTRLGSGMWVFNMFITRIKNWFGLGGIVGTALKFVLGISFKTMLGAGSVLWQLIGWIGNIFKPENGRIAGWLKTLKVRALWMWVDIMDTPAGKFIKWIGDIFGPKNGKFAYWLGQIKAFVGGKFTVWFGEGSKMREIFKWIGSFFGSADEGGKIAKAIQSITQNKAIAGIGKFLGTIGAKMLKFFGPIGWLIAGYDAVMAFWETFQSTEGSLWDKTVAGLSAGIQAIVDFFVFDLIQLAEDSIKWLIKKVMGLFGYDEAEIEKSDWFTFSITGFLKDAFGDYMKFFEGIFRLDPTMALEGLKGMWGAAADALGWLFDIAIKPAINWLAEFFGISKEGEDLIGKEFSLSKWIKETLIDPIIEFLGNLFDMDFQAMAKQLMPSALYNFLFEDKTAAKAFESGAFIDDYGMNSVDTDKLKAMLQEGTADDQKKTLAGLINAYNDNTGNLEDVEREKLKVLLNEFGAKLNKGGFVPAGKSIPAILHGPELIKPLPDLEKGGMLGGQGAVNAPTTIINKSTGSTSMLMGSSSEDKSNWKYGMQGA